MSDLPNTDANTVVTANTTVSSTSTPIVHAQKADNIEQNVGAIVRVISMIVRLVTKLTKKKTA
jgi:hypothetical protein